MQKSGCTNSKKSGRDNITHHKPDAFIFWVIPLAGVRRIGRRPDRLLTKYFNPINDVPDKYASAE
jgi:hypothetical protein